ncbi:hypothetical protein RND71_022201 [Anisodus tanguticus]|uniref:Leucine-rich repeat-containing N-terminal plant-type domain-containing protein n=1 Tax=Anisodus tanguticus TaxID=243964 RepID=A0AAE1RZK7_9SOLA|nr:hypothetical protein RND71_022201 [Anisodus tanguticus]
MTSKIVYWWWLILFIANGWCCCYCCWKEERIALLQLKANINYSTGGDYLPSWLANETSDCCQWDGIVCSNKTRRVTELSITVERKNLSTLNGTNTDDILTNWLFNASLFTPFKNLKALLLPGHSLAGWVKNEGFEKLRQLRKLERLDLSENQFNRSIFASLSQLSSLKSLNLAYNNIGSGSNIRFTDNKIGSELGALSNIEYLLLDGNTLDENFLGSSGVMSSLKVLSVAHCNLSGTLPLQDFLSLSQCNIGGNFPNWLLENNPKLGEVYLDGNAFTGYLQLSFLPNLKALNISNNRIQGQLPPNIGSIFPNLVVLTMSNNLLEGLLPSSLGDMKDLLCLDMSYNKLTGDLPIGLARKGSFLNFLRLSYNMFKGEINPISANINNLEYLYLNGNNFSGPIPQKLSTVPLRTLDLSNNKLSGNIPAWLGNISSLTSLALYKNHLKGQIPPDYCRLERLKVLHLSENNIAGVIPSCFSTFHDLERVYLSKNKLQGGFDMFSTSDLKVLDLSDNNFSGSIPKWLGSTPEITTLILRGNRLQGTIPPQLCHASYLRFLDLSHNNLSGPIPHCVGNIMQQARVPEVYPYSSSFIYIGLQTFGEDAVVDVEFSIVLSSPIFFLDNYVWVGAEFTTKYNTYSYEGSIVDHMSGIDLSYNQLSGEIPKELGNLTKVHSLNLSHNHITGTIPSLFSNLQNIESLDLSYNNLTGRIPTQLLELATLSVFTVAYNNLTGRTPQRSAQFATFDESSYEGNPFLCGLPLHIRCMETKEIPILPPGPDCCEEDTGFLDIESFYISFLVAYANVVLVMVVVLWVEPFDDIYELVLHTKESQKAKSAFYVMWFWK